MDASKNESIVLDNIFFFGYNFEDKSRELIDQAVQSDYPVPEPAEPEASPTAEPGQTEQSGQTQSAASAAGADTPGTDSTSETQSPALTENPSESDGSLVWYIVGAAVILCAAAVVIIVMVRKSKGKAGE